MKFENLPTGLIRLASDQTDTTTWSKTMNTETVRPTRLTAVLAAIALTAAACGGGADTAEADRIAELEAQVEALSAQSEQTATTTQAPAKEKPEPTVVVATTEAPTLEPEPEAPEETEPAEVVDDAPTPTDGFATPNGPAITANSTAVEMVAIMQDIAGPTDDLPATFARIGRLPIVTTMPDTALVDYFYTVQNEYIWSDQPGGHRSTSQVQFTTSALPQDVLLAYQTEFAAQGFGNLSTGEQNQNDITFYTARMGEFSTGLWDIVAWERDGVNNVELKYVIDQDEPKPEAVDAVAGFAAGIPVPDGAKLDQVSIRRFGTGTVKLDAQHNMAGVDLVTAEQGHDERVAAAGWTFDQMVASSFKLTSAAEPGQWTLRYAEFDTSSTNSENNVRTIQYTTYDAR